MGGDREDAGLDRLFDSYNPDDFEDEGWGSKRKRKPDPGHDLGEVEVVRETDNALCVRGEGLSSDPFGLKDQNEEAWIPKSQIHERSPLQEDCGVGARGHMVISRWLAGKRGLV